MLWFALGGAVSHVIANDAPTSPTTTDDPGTPTPLVYLESLPATPDAAPAIGELPTGATAPSLFDAANAAFTAGQYAAALEQYEALMARGWASPALYFNAGNAAAQLNRKALAVLYFERALRLTPRDPDIHYNLRLVAPPDNFQPVFFLFRPFWFVRHQLRPGELFALAAGLYVLSNLAFAMAFVWRASGLRRAGRWIGAAALALALFVAGNLYAIHHEQRTAPPGIVMQAATARSGPGENFKSVLELPEGLKIHDKGPAAPGWREVQLLTGQTAYLPATALTLIAP